MKKVAIIQARRGSRRLPDKVLLEVAGRSVLEWVIARASAIPGIDEVAVATTTNDEDRTILELAESLHVKAHPGSENDVLDRYMQAARWLHADVVMRLTADCPLLDPEISGRVLSRFLEGDLDYASNVIPPSFPDGLDTEVFAAKALERAWSEAQLPSEREHVTPYIWSRPEVFRLGAVRHDTDLSSLRWTLDEPRDLELIRAIYARLPLGAEDAFRMETVLDLLKRDPDLIQINQAIQRNEGYLSALKKDPK